MGLAATRGIVSVVQGWAKQRGLKFQLWLSPTTLSNDRKESGLAKVAGGQEFR